MQSPSQASGIALPGVLKWSSLYPTVVANCVLARAPFSPPWYDPAN